MVLGHSEFREMGVGVVTYGRNILGGKQTLLTYRYAIAGDRIR